MQIQNMLFIKIWIFLDYWPLILIVSQLWSNINCQPPGYGIFTDRYVRVQRGLCAHVPCTFTVPRNIRLSRDTNGFWAISLEQTIVTVASRVNSIHNSNRHFNLIGNVTKGDCSFSIERARDIDERVYFFRIEDPQTQYTYTNIQPYVEVTGLTDKPTISSTRLVDGKEVTMTCTSPGRCRNIAQPRISWEGAVAGTRLVTYTTTYEDGSRTFHSNITFTPRKSHNNSPLFCRATFQQDLSTMGKRTLNVEYSPSINITIGGVDTNDMTSVIVEDGDSVTLRCIVDSNPNASITWYKDDIMVHRDVRDQIVTIQLLNITESDAGRYRCSAMNEHGVTHRSLQIIYQSTNSQFNPVIAAVVGGVFFLVLIILVGVLVIMYLKKRRQRSADENLKDTRANCTNDDTYSYAEFTRPEVSPPEKTLQKAVNAGDDSIYANSDEVQYSSVAFSKLKRKVIQEDVETEYSAIKKVPHK